MDRTSVLAAFNKQVRQSVTPDGTGAEFDADDCVVRRIAPPGQEGSGVFWSNLDPARADAVIAEQIAVFGGRGQRFEWKIYDYDKPADLADRLAAAGFVAEDAESFVVAEVSEVREALRSAELPAGVTAVRVTDSAGVELMGKVQELVFEDDRSDLREAILAQLARAPDVVEIVLAIAGDKPVSAARIEFLPGTEFAGLWGGGTLREWRRRGIYRALVRYRAELAATRGYKYLTVDASPDSRPILERVGFTCLAITTPYVWTPPDQAGATSLDSLGWRTHEHVGRAAPGAFGSPAGDIGFIPVRGAEDEAKCQVDACGAAPRRPEPSRDAAHDGEPVITRRPRRFPCARRRVAAARKLFRAVEAVG